MSKVFDICRYFHFTDGVITQAISSMFTETERGARVKEVDNDKLEKF